MLRPFKSVLKTKVINGTIKPATEDALERDWFWWWIGGSWDAKESVNHRIRAWLLEQDCISNWAEHATHGTTGVIREPGIMDPESINHTTYYRYDGGNGRPTVSRMSYRSRRSKGWVILLDREVRAYVPLEVPGGLAQIEATMPHVPCAYVSIRWFIFKNL